MPHPESEHGLRVQLATALQDLRDAHAQIGRERDAWVAANARADAAVARSNDLAGFLDEVHALNRSALGELAATRESLASARRECEGLRKALRNIVGVWKEIHDDAKHRRMWILGWDTWLGVIAAGAALAAPAAGEEGKR